MMTRIGGQVQPGSYDAILKQTEQEQHTAANPAMPPVGQAPQQQWPPQQQQPQWPAQQQPQWPAQQQQPQWPAQQPGVPQYDPRVMQQPQQPGQGQVNFEGMPPFAGMPGSMPAFEASPGGGVGGHTVMQPVGWDQEPQLPDQMCTQVGLTGPAMLAPGSLWTRYGDLVIVALIVYLLIRYALPHARRFLPTVFGNLETSMPAAAILSLSAGAAFYGSKKVLPRP